MLPNCALGRRLAASPPRCLAASSPLANSLSAHPAVPPPQRTPDRVSPPRPCHTVRRHRREAGGRVWDGARLSQPVLHATRVCRAKIARSSLDSVAVGRPEEQFSKPPHADAVAQRQPLPPPARVPDTWRSPGQKGTHARAGRTRSGLITPTPLRPREYRLRRRIPAARAAHPCPAAVGGALLAAPWPPGRARTALRAAPSSPQRLLPPPAAAHHRPGQVAVQPAACGLNPCSSRSGSTFQERPRWKRPPARRHELAPRGGASVGK